MYARTARRVIGATLSAEGAICPRHAVEPIVGPSHLLLLFPGVRAAGGGASSLLVALPGADTVLKLAELQLHRWPDLPARRVDDVGPDRGLPVE